MPTTELQPSPVPRNASLDYARLAAAFGIVLFHSGAAGGRTSYAALPFFVMILVVMAGRTARSMDLRGFLASRWSRLMLPWLLWSAIYAALKIADAWISGQPIGAEFEVWMLGTGPAIHLWFLPFAFVVSALLHPVIRSGLLEHAPSIGLLAALILILLLLQRGDTGLSPPFAQWFFALPATMFGLILSRSPDRRSYVLFAQGLAIGVFLAAWALGAGTAALPFLIASLALTACLLLKTRETALSRICAATALGVYLVHPIISALLGRYTALAPGSWPFFGLIASISFLVALLLPKAAALLVNFRKGHQLES
jgi:surface polysaccharide O-acyltransferase-like enzyme